MRSGSLVGKLERAFLGAAMSAVVFVLERRLSRGMKRRKSKAG